MSQSKSTKTEQSLTSRQGSPRHDLPQFLARANAAADTGRIEEAVRFLDDDAVTLAAKPHAIAKIRASMRQRMLVGKMCDANGFARTVEAAYRKMWHRWCKPRSSVLTAGCSQKSRFESRERSRQM